MSNYSRLIEIFEKLVSFRTVTGDHEAAKACLAYVEKLLIPSGMHINNYSSNGFHSLVATTQDTKSPTLLLQAHLDVVPGANELFTLQGKGPKLVGRGAFDMKFAAASYLWIIEELCERIKDYDVGIMFTTDEEDGGLDGVDYLLDQGYSCKACILPDGGDKWQIETAAKGLWQFDVVANGTSAHGSRPWLGDNAATKLLSFIADTKGFAPAGDRTETTMVLTKLDAGEARNQIPAKAVASFDIRFLDESERNTIEKKVIKLANKHGMYLEKQRHAAAIKLDPTIPAIKQWEDTVARMRGKKPAGYGLSYGSSDARYFADRGIPTIVTRPKGGGHHGDDEWIDESELYEFAECLRAFVEFYASQDSTKVA